MSDENKFFEPDRPGRPSSQKNVASNFKRDGFPESAAGLASGVIFSNESPASSSSSSSDSEDTGDFQPKDAFVLFNQAERGVQEIVRELEAYRITLYFYGRDVTFGENWLNRESAELKNCRCVLLFLGQAGWGPTHREWALQAADQGKLIIPVLLAKPTDAADLNVGGLFSELRYFELFNP
ncbi:MAG: toll/interleukin-1 receptor domain-containing protein, partial [Planctomyces sp.]